MRSFLLLAATAAILAGGDSAVRAEANATVEKEFQRQVRPLVEKFCVGFLVRFYI